MKETFQSSLSLANFLQTMQLENLLCKGSELTRLCWMSLKTVTVRFSSMCPTKNWVMSHVLVWSLASHLWFEVACVCMCHNICLFPVLSLSSAERKDYMYFNTHIAEVSPGSSLYLAGAIERQLFDCPVAKRSIIWNDFWHTQSVKNVLFGWYLNWQPYSSLLMQQWACTCNRIHGTHVLQYI